MNELNRNNGYEIGKDTYYETNQFEVIQSVTHIHVQDKFNLAYFEESEHYEGEGHYQEPAKDTEPAGFSFYVV